MALLYIGTFLRDGGIRSCRADPGRFVSHPVRIDALTCQCIIAGHGANAVRIYSECLWQAAHICCHKR